MIHASIHVSSPAMFYKSPSVKIGRARKDRAAQYMIERNTALSFSKRNQTGPAVLEPQCVSSCLGRNGLFCTGIIRNLRKQLQKSALQIEPPASYTTREWWSKPRALRASSTTIPPNLPPATPTTPKIKTFYFTLARRVCTKNTLVQSFSFYFAP